LAELDMQARPEVLIGEMLHANVTLRFRGFHAVNRVDLPGPLAVTLLFSHSATAVRVTNTKTGKYYCLEALPHEDPTAGIRASLAQGNS